MNIRPASGMVRDTLACRRQISYSASLMATNDLARSYSRPRPASTAPVRSTSEKQSWELSDADGSSLEDEKLVVVNVAGSKYPVGKPGERSSYELVKKLQSGLTQSLQCWKEGGRGLSFYNIPVCLIFTRINK